MRFPAGLASLAILAACSGAERAPAPADHARRLYWLHASGAIESRDWPGESLSRSPQDRYSGGVVQGGLARTADGRWLAAFLTDGAVRLVAFDADGMPRAQTLSFDGGGRERGAGVLAEGDALWVALVEPIEGGGAELRLRPVDADLRLGAAQAIARAAPGEALALPSCGAAAPAAEMLLEGPGEGRITVAGAELAGALARQVRFDRNGACAARTRVDGRDAFTAVLRGNGEGAMVIRRQEQPLGGGTCRLGTR